MVACAHCGGCCAHCGAVCSGVHGVPGVGIAGAFGGGGYFGGVGYMPWVGGTPFFHHKKRDDDDEPKKVDCDALADPNHPDHRDAVTTISHVDDDTHESILKRIREDLAKL
jgi:hypothetical protein